MNPKAKPSQAMLFKAPVFEKSPRLEETAVGEGNTLEYALFALTNKGARPNRGRNPEGILLYAEEDYTRVHELSANERVTVRASIQHGFPTTFALRVFLAVLDLAQVKGWPGRKVPCTMIDIARRVGMEDPGGRGYFLIRQALQALGIRLTYENLWHDPATNTIVPLTHEEPIVTMFELGNKNSRTDFVELGEQVYESAKRGYRVGIDLDYMNRLKSPTAERLYSYLTKKDQRATYKERLLNLAKKLPLEANFPSKIKKALDPALRALSTPLDDGKCFLQGFGYEGKGADTSVIVTFANFNLRSAVHAAVGFDPEHGGKKP